MLERFHHNARMVVGQARDEAARLGKRTVGTEHLLLGLLARPGHAADALRAAGADPAGLLERISGVADGPASLGAADGPASSGVADGPASLGAETAAPHSADQHPAGSVDSGFRTAAVGSAGERHGGGSDSGGEAPMTANASRAVEAALHAAQRLGHRQVTSGHLLLGVIDQQGSQAVQALTVAGIHVGTLRVDVLRRITSEPGPDVR